MLGYAPVFALWIYFEALLSSRISVSTIGGFSVALLGWVGVFIASLAKLPLLRLLSLPSTRRLALLISSITLAMIPLQYLLTPQGGFSYVSSYILASVAYGLVSAAVFATIVNDVDYVEWSKAITSSSMLAYTLTLGVLLTWSLMGVDLSIPLALTSTAILLATIPTMRGWILPSMTLKTIEVIADILSFRRNPKTYTMWYLDVAKLAVITGGLGALKIAVLSTAMREHGVTSLIALSLGALIASMAARYHAKPRIAMITAIPAATSTLVAGSQLLTLALLGLAITYSYLTITITVLESKPKAVYKATLVLTIATAIGSLATGLTSLADPRIASKIVTFTTTILVTTVILLTIRRGKENWES